MAIEKLKYKVLFKDEDFEIRSYPKFVMVRSPETSLRGGIGFSRLFNYISGTNSKDQRISMTAPVINDLHNNTTAFVMPEKMTLDNLPSPVQTAVEVVEMPPRLMACLSFRGKVNQEIIEMRIADLKLCLVLHDYKSIGEVELARYNPPFVLDFMKYHEVLVEVQHKPEIPHE